MRHIPLAICHTTGQEEEFILDAIKTNWITPLGPHVDAFEKTMAEYIGVGFGAATSSGTAAIHLSLIEAGVTKNDTVLCSDMTFAATCNPVKYIGAKLVFVDCNESTFNIDISSLKKAVKEHPEAKYLLIAHLYGQSCDMDPILEICKEHHLTLIEDAAEALGSTYKGKMCGSFGDYSAISFNGNKIITTSGGGMVLSNNEEGIKHIRFLATQARDKAYWYQHSELGYNYRMSNICAAIGRGQFKDIQRRIAKKRSIYKRYANGLKNTKAYMMPLADYGVSNCWLSALLFKKDVKKSPIELLEYLKSFDIETRPIWKPMHLQPIYQDSAFVTSSTDKPFDEDIFERGLCLPSDIEMTETEQDFVIQKIKEFLDL